MEEVWARGAFRRPLKSSINLRVHCGPWSHLETWLKVGNTKFWIWAQYLISRYPMASPKFNFELKCSYFDTYWNNRKDFCLVKVSKKSSSAAQFEIIIGKPNLYKFSFLYNEARIFKTLAIFFKRQWHRKMSVLWLLNTFVHGLEKFKTKDQIYPVSNCADFLSWHQMLNVSIIISSLSRSHPDWGEEFVTAKKVN